jgi:ABC-2 type transport system permease protein
MADPRDRLTGGRLIRTLAFFRKDVVEVLRQPRLIFTLVLGPFLILMLFGFGFRPAPPTLRTVLVVPEGSGLAERSEELAQALGSRVSLIATTGDEQEGTALLASGDADVMVVIPGDALATVQGNERASISVRHDQIDPFESSFIELFAQSAVDQVNRRVLRELVAVGQERAAAAEAALATARAAITAMEQALETGDPHAAEASRGELIRALDQIATEMEPSLMVWRGLEAEVGASSEGADALAAARETADALGQPQQGEQTQELLNILEGDLDALETQLTVFRAIDPSVLVSPFTEETSNFQGIEIPFSNYYIPGVVSLLAQHLAITFAALSLVRERTLGTVELFRVSPVSGGEALIGKYLASLTIGALVVGALTAAAVAFFDFRPAGTWGWYALSTVLVLLASQGLGFVLAAAAANESQAVQYAMIALLVSIFFSGFFISVERLIPPVRALSFLIPASYGIVALQDIAFRGSAPSGQTLGGAALLGVVLLLSAWQLLRRRIVTAR